MNLRFACPECDCPGRLELPGPREWQCPACDHLLRLRAANDDEAGQVCVCCGNQELYRKKDFPHWLGMTILVVACAASFVTYWLRRQWMTWSILLGSALIDGCLYMSVSDVTVCYRCGCQQRGVQGTHPPFELTIAERYRQERIRREQLQMNKKPLG